MQKGSRRKFFLKIVLLYYTTKKKFASCIAATALLLYVFPTWQKSVCTTITTNNYSYYAWIIFNVTSFDFVLKWCYQPPNDECFNPRFPIAAWSCLLTEQGKWKSFFYMYFFRKRKMMFGQEIENCICGTSIILLV